MTFNHQRNAGFRLVLIAALVAALYGLLPVRVIAEEAPEALSLTNDCNPDAGWMWTTGPSQPDTAAQVQQDLAQQGIGASVEARGYGETDGCGTYHPHGIDFTIKLPAKGSKQAASPSSLADRILPVVTKHGKPGLGTVRLLSSDGTLILNDLNNEMTTITSLEMDAEALAAQAPAGDTITRKVYVIVYDPLMQNGQLLSQSMGWNSHTTITQQTVDFFKQATNNRMNYVVAQTTVVTNGWPQLVDGFVYTEPEYLAVMAGQLQPHQPTGVDYNKIVNDPQLDLCGKVNRGEIDEVWIYNGPWFGFYESTLVGPGAYWFNSSPVGGTHNCNRLLPIMGPSPERTTNEAVHNFTHRAESTMAKVYGSWSQNSTSHNWNKFALVKAQSSNYSYSGCGSSHFPPNATSAYSYSSTASVLSNCDDFANYPDLSDPLQVAQPVTCSAWGCLEINYYKYWFSHFPAFLGCGPDSVANDWWRYLASPAYALYPANGCQTDMHLISGNVGAPNALLSYYDGGAKTVTTDASGNYLLMVSNHWSGTVTPSRLGYTFTPASRNYTDVQTDVYEQNYMFEGGGPYYVNIATGNTSNACTSKAAPCRNIQEAINRANAGDTIYVASGRYLFSTNPSPNVATIDKDLTLSGGWNSDFSSQSGASTIDGANVNNGILIISGTVTVENFIIENSTSFNGGGMYVVNGNVTLKKTTLRNNRSDSNGAGIFLDNGALTIINSTISGNRANGEGGGIYASLNSSASVTLLNSTIAYNQASRAGGIRRTNGTYNIKNTIVANNSASVASPDCEGVIWVANFSIIENLMGCSITGPSNLLNVDPLLDGTLTGPMLVHLLLSGSPAVNAGTISGCPSTDQQGTDRPQAGSCDIGAVESFFTSTNTPTYTPTFTPTPTKTTTPTPTFTPTMPSTGNGLYLSLTGSQSISGVSSSDEDILRFDGATWSLFFDGSDVGVASPDLFAFSMLDADTILMAFSANVTVNGIAATPNDILRFDAMSLGTTTSGTWSMYFDGSDAGFDSTAEKIDSVTLLSDGRLLFSTTGNPAVTGLSGLADEDILAFTPTSLGDNTSGTWALYFDGSDVGLSTSSGEDIDALDVTSNGYIYLSSLDNFSVPGASGADEDVFACAPTSLGSNTACTFSPTLYFDGSAFGLASNDVDAIHLLTMSAPLTPTPTPTGTPIGLTATFTPTATVTGIPPTPTATYTPTPTATHTPTPTGTTSSSDMIFADDFESGSLAGWTSSSTDAGDLSVSPGAALVGSQGLQVMIDDANVLSLTSDHPNAEPLYRARFYFDPNSISMANGDTHIILRGYSGSSTVVLRMEFGYSAGGYQVRAGLVNDGTTFTDTSWAPLTDAPHVIELDWRAASAAGANNGGLVVWIDGLQHQLLSNIDNDTRRIDRLVLGALAGIDTGTRGAYYFDAFESRRQSYIGP